MKSKPSIIRNETGLSLIELIVTMALVIIVLTMNTDTFGVIMRQSKLQMQEAAGAMDRIVGLEMLRRDVELAGFGLPWTFGGTVSYSEAPSKPGSDYNDSPSNPPRAFVMAQNKGVNGSDYLVIKSTGVGTSTTAQKWSYILYGSSTARTWGSPKDLTSGERVTVIKPNATTGLDRQLVMDGTAIFTTISDASATIPSKFRPTTTSSTNFVFGVDPTTDLRMPFNRVDYFIGQTSVPQSCAPGTGVLYKGLLRHSDGTIGTPLPVLDCVAAMQVVFRLDTNMDGIVDTVSDDISALTAQAVRQQVKEVRIYILSHTGEKDLSFWFLNGGATAITVGEFGKGSAFNFESVVGSDWRHYRWKIDTLVVRTNNLVS